MKKRTGVIWVLCMAAVGAFSCGNEDNENETVYAVYTVEKCIAEWTMLGQCDLNHPIPDIPQDELEEACILAVDYTNCKSNLYSDSCRPAYNRYMDCSSALNSCAELSAFYDGVGAAATGEGSPSTFPCQSEWKAYEEACLNTVDESADNIEDECEEEINAYAEFFAPYYEDSESTDWE